METENLWNAYVRLTNGQEREFVFRGLSEDADHLRQYLSNNKFIRESGVSVEYADFDANDVIEEVAAWIDGEY